MIVAIKQERALSIFKQFLPCSGKNQSHSGKGITMETVKKKKKRRKTKKQWLPEV